MSSQYKKPPSGFGFARAQDKAFDAVRSIWLKRKLSGLTQSEVATRIGRDEAWISRKLSGPSNWTLRTLGDLADALDGEVEIYIADIHDDQRSNFDAYQEHEVTQHTASGEIRESHNINHFAG